MMMRRASASLICFKVINMIIEQFELDTVKMAKYNVYSAKLMDFDN